MDEFIKSCLKPILNSEVDNEIVDYIKDIKVVEDFEEFIDNILDTTNPEHAKMYEKLKTKLFGPTNTKTVQQQSVPSSSRASKNKNQSAKKSEHEAFPSLPGNRNEITQKTSSRTPGQSKASSSKETSKSFVTPDKKDFGNGKIEQVHSSGKGKKTKFQKIENFDMTVGMKKGRHPCNCEAITHPLINNCLKCGRIVCEQEGSGPCFFCDTMVCRNEEEQVLESNTKQADRLYNHLKTQKTSKEWKKAIEMRDRLIQADKSREYKRQVYDDQGDYYTTDNWKTKSKNSEVVQRIHNSRKDMKLALDFASRMVISTETEFDKNREQFLKGVDKLIAYNEKRFPVNAYNVSNEFSSKNIDDNIKTTETNDENPKEDKRKDLYGPSTFSKVKVANDAFLSEIDRGMCLSMHQPWASLLVAGIKMHEGRTWYTEHRGRLWIHAASKEPQNAEILEIEKMYRELYNDPELKFPQRYPTGCLLGCVFVETCLNQKRYRELYTEGESDSPYVLICNNPMVLPVFYPMQGQHKIFPLTKQMHKVAREAIMSSKWL